MVTRVRRTFGDEAAVQVTDDDIIRWINDGQVEIVKQNDAALQKTSLVNIVAGQAQYAMPTDLLILRSLRYKLPDMTSFSSLRYKNMQEFDDQLDGWDGTTYAQGYPQLFTLYEGLVMLFPVPSASMTSGLKVLYNQKPTDVTALVDALSLPAIYHTTIVQYCLWQASLLDEDLEPSVMYKNDFTANINSSMNTETSDPSATYPVISVRDCDM